LTAHVVDSLAFFGPSLFGGGQGRPELEQLMSDLNVDRCVAIAARPPEYDLSPANEAVAALTSSSGGRIVGLVRVDPNRSDAAGNVRYGLDELNLRGLFLHPGEEHFRITDGRVIAAVEECASRGCPVVVASAYPWLSEALQVADLARRFPGIPFVMTNGGQFNISGMGQLDALLALDMCPNLMIQTTGVYRQDFLERVASNLGADRIMFGGGSPVFDARYEILRVRLANLDAGSREAILGGTASRVFGL
jgi:predicted TIM-barrel fold metal-dependent hydrolase